MRYLLRVLIGVVACIALVAKVHGAQLDCDTSAMRHVSHAPIPTNWDGHWNGFQGASAIVAFVNESATCRTSVQPDQVAADLVNTILVFVDHGGMPATALTTTSDVKVSFKEIVSAMITVFADDKTLKNTPRAEPNVVDYTRLCVGLGAGAYFSCPQQTADRDGDQTAGLGYRDVLIAIAQNRACGASGNTGFASLQEFVDAWVSVDGNLNSNPDAPNHMCK